MNSVKTLPFFEAIRVLSLPGLDRNLFSSPEWMEVLDKTYKIKLFVKYIEENGRIKSYIIYSSVDNFLEKKICICSYCDYCDGYISDRHDWDSFFESIRKEYPDYRIAIRNLRDGTVRENPHFEFLSKERFHFLDIRVDLTNIWKKTHDSFRSAVKQAQNSGVVVKIGGRAELDKFYNFHLKLRKNKYRIFPQPFRFFEKIWDVYLKKDKGILLCAYDKSGEFLAASIYLMCGNTFYYKLNTSGLNALRLRPNNLLFWEGIRIAKERGFEFIDLGSSGCDQEGLILFKNHTGATAMDICHYGFTPPGYVFSRKIILKTYTRFFTLPFIPNIMIRWGSNLIYPYLA